MEDLEKRFEEIEDVEEIEETEEETPRRSGIGTFGAMAIGSGLTLGGIALFKKLKKVVAAKKAAKEAAENSPEIIEAEAVEVVEPKPETTEEPKQK